MSSSVCQICGVLPGQSHPELSSILPGPICAYCLKPSYGGNWRHLGRPAASSLRLSSLPTFSVEFEIKGDSSGQRSRALALLPLGYLRAPDGTVDDEYKSPIYHSLCAFRSHLPALNTLRDLVNQACGTHLHVGMPQPLLEHLSGIRDEVFGPLIDHLLEKKEETEWFWGRTFCKYASSDLDDDYPCIWVRRHYDTLEYRLPRFRSAEQYLGVVRFCRRLTSSLHRALLPLAAGLEEADTPDQLGEDVLVLYRDTVERQWRWLHRPHLHAEPCQLAS
jgi:hypothetical protein